MNRFCLSCGAIALFILLGAASCNKNAVPQKTVQEVQTDFADDLSKYRPVVAATDGKAGEAEQVIANEPMVSQYDISNKLNVVLDSVRQQNFDSGELEGYAILVYSGVNETEAGRIRNRLYDIVPDLEARIQYTLPTYFVKIGKFHQRIEAQPLYQQVRKYYPDATVVPDKFPIE